MRDEDPFDSWRFYAKEYTRSGSGRSVPIDLRQRLDCLERELDAARTAQRRPDYSGARLSWMVRVALPARDLDRVQQLYRRVVEQGGAGSTFVQNTLLDLVGHTASPGSIPFWREMLSLTIARDSYSRKRQRFAVAALAWLVVRHGEEAALEQLLETLGAGDADARALAADHLGLAFAVAETDGRRAPPPRVLEALASAATRDTAALPRLSARLALRDLEVPVPPDLPGGAYAFKVWHSWDPTVYRVVELAAEQSLDRLHDAIQDAFDWDADHLYVFWLSGKARDWRYEAGHPQTEDVRSRATDFTLGELGLPKGHTFLYLFDFGDNHLFRIRVVGSRAEAGDDPLPRVTKSVGDSPPQYRSCD